MTVVDVFFVCSGVTPLGLVVPTVSVVSVRWVVVRAAVVRGCCGHHYHRCWGMVGRGVCHYWRRGRNVRDWDRNRTRLHDIHTFFGVMVTAGEMVHGKIESVTVEMGMEPVTWFL